MKKWKRIISLLMICALTLANVPQMVSAQEVNADITVEKKIITGFEQLETMEQNFQINKLDKPSLEQLTDAMPETLEVYIGEEKEEIEVTWECVGEDYEASEAYYFQFSPVWNEEQYSLADGIEVIKDAPYISVFFYDAENGLDNSSVTGRENETIIYDFLKNNMGFNTAAACGVLANIFHESGFNPNLTGDNGTSYGICQWHNSRWDTLKSYCETNGYDWTTLEGQLYYLKFELSQNNSNYLYNGKKIYDYISSVENTAEGAYDAGYYWCYYFEVPANKDVVSVTRGNLAKNTYWPVYNVDTSTLPAISGANYPGTLTAGKAFSIAGTVVSGTELTNVTVGCYDVNGTMKTGKETDPSGTTYDLKNIDNYISFGKLTPGVYYYRVIATNANGTEILVDHPFIVLAKTETISDGLYQIHPAASSDFSAGSADDSKEAGANVELVNAANVAGQTFTITYDSDGYYMVRNCNSGLYLEAADGEGSGTNVIQAEEKGDSSQRWQILPVGDGYCLVPECANTTCLEVQNGTYRAGSNILISTASLEEEQIFSLVSSTGQFEENMFSDVFETDYYYDAVLWAVENGITAGKDETHFAPTEECTRAQVVTFLWRSQGSPEPKTTKNPFVDVASDKYYTKAVLWAYENEITAGKDATHFQPDETVTRGQFVTFLWRLEGKPSVTITNPFVDVKDGMYYKEAVLWAYENGITAGKDATHFQPEASCQRCQVVTFLYRAYK